MAQNKQDRQELFEAVEAYIEKRYVPEQANSFLGLLGDVLRSAGTGAAGTAGLTLGAPADRAMKGILDAVASAVDATFAEQLLRLMAKSGKKPSTVYTKAGVTKQHFSKIKNNADYKPTKETALAFAVVLHLSLEETKDLLGRAGFALSRSSKRDLIVEYFIKEGLYDVDEINYNLDSRGLGTLTNRRNSA